MHYNCLLESYMDNFYGISSYTILKQYFQDRNKLCKHRNRLVILEKDKIKNYFLVH